MSSDDENQIESICQTHQKQNKNHINYFMRPKKVKSQTTGANDQVTARKKNQKEKNDNIILIMVILQRSNSRKKISKLKIVINSMMKIIDDNDGDYHHYHHNDRLYWLVEIYTHMHTSSQFLPTKEKNIKNFSSDL